MNDRTTNRQHTLRLLAAERRKTEPTMAAVPETIPDDEGETPPPIDTNEMFATLWAQRHNANRLESLERAQAGSDKVVDELLRQSIVFEELMPMWRATAKHVDILAEARTKEVARSDQFYETAFPELKRLVEKIDGRLDTFDTRMTAREAVQVELQRNDTEQGRQLAKLGALELQLSNLVKDREIAEALRVEREKSAARRFATWSLVLGLTATLLAVVLAHFIH